MTYADIGGLDMQKQEIREAVELPLTHFDLYRQIGIDPPRGSTYTYNRSPTVWPSWNWKDYAGQGSR